MIPLTVVMSTTLFAFWSVCIASGFFALGCIFRGKKGSDFEQETRYWERMKAIENDDPERAVNNGNVPEWKKVK